MTFMSTFNKKKKKKKKKKIKNNADKLYLSIPSQ